MKTRDEKLNKFEVAVDVGLSKELSIQPDVEIVDG